VLIQLLNGLSYGAVLFLLAAGLSLVIGFMGILNMAHGALFLFGAYVGVTVAQHGGNFLVAALAGGAAAAVIGVIMQRGFFRYLTGLRTQVLISFGFIYVLTNTATWIWGTVTQVVSFPVSGSMEVGGLQFPVYRLALLGIGAVVAIGLYLMDRTRVGAIVRAGMDNSEMVSGLGINVKLISSLVFGLGSFIAGFAGILGVPIFGAYPQIAMDALTLSMIVVVVGGLGSIQGALIAALLLGVLDAFGKALFPGLASYTIYLALIAFLVFRPRGLMGRAL
jgi:branched-chain amino acid transport system permease protein